MAVTDHLRRIAHGNGVWQNLMHDERRCPDDALLADMVSHDRFVADPRVAADSHVQQLALLLPNGDAEIRIAVLCEATDDMRVRTQQNVVFDRTKPKVAVSADVHP